MRNSTLNYVSPKRRKVNVIYNAAVKLWRCGCSGQCEMLFSPAPNIVARVSRGDLTSIRCNKTAMNQPHHRAGRGKNLCNINTFSALCFDCHRWVHDNPREARKLGWLECENPKH